MEGYPRLIANNVVLVNTTLVYRLTILAAESDNVGEYGLDEVVLVADTPGQRPGGNVSQPQILLDEHGSRYYVTVLNCPAPGHVLAAELVCYKLLERLNLANFDAYIAYIDFALEPRWEQRESGIMVPASVGVGDCGIPRGPHYATKELPEGHYPVTQLEFDDLARPEDALAVWVFDTWVGIADRRQDGNLRAIPVAGDGRYMLVPIDNGNAFWGPQWDSASLQEMSALSPRPEAVRGTDTIARRIGIEVIPQIIESVDNIDVVDLQQIAEAVPPEWAFGQDRQSTAISYLVKRRTVLSALFPEGRM